MKKALWWIIGIIVLAAILAIILSSSGSSKYDNFAQCLTDKGAKMYGASWCSHCQEQKKLFGQSWDKVNYIECATKGNSGQNEVCNIAGIESYPTWTFADKNPIPGVLSMQQLSSFTGCDLPAE